MVGVEVWELEPAIFNPILLSPKVPMDEGKEGCPRYEDFLSTIPPPELFELEFEHCSLNPEKN